MIILTTYCICKTRNSILRPALFPTFFLSFLLVSIPVTFLVKNIGLAIVIQKPDIYRDSR